MKSVNVEVQQLTYGNPRGVALFITELLSALIRKNNYKYSASFFDYQKEMNNYKNVHDCLNRIVDEVDIRECNELNYRTIMEGVKNNKPDLYNKKSYGEYFNLNSDIYYFPQVFYLPENVHGNMVVTVHDLIPVMKEYKTMITP